jgi:predicted PurR-regulated permease PerM
LSQTDTPPGVPRPLATAAAISWRVLVVVAAVVALIYALVELRLVVLPVIVAIFAATLLVPPARWLVGRGVPELAATFVVLLGSIALAVGVVSLLAPTVVDEFSGLGDDVRAGVEDASNFLTSGPLDLSQEQIDNAVSRGEEQLQSNSGAFTQGAVTGAVLVGELIAGLLLTVVLLFFFIKDGAHMWRWSANLFPARSRRDVDEIGQRAWSTLGGYLRGIALVAVVNAVLLGIVLLIVGVPLVPALMTLTFVGAFFPLIGAILAGLVAALVALASNGLVAALIVLAAIVVIQQVEGDLLYPLVVGKALEIHPVAILLSLTAGAVLGGVVGAFLAVPVAAVINSAASYLRSRPPPGAQDGPAPAS